MSFEHTEPTLRKLLDGAHSARADYERARTNEEDRLHALSNAYGAWITPSPQLLGRDWVAVAVEFTLQAPWYSRDDVPLHVLDNPVRRDRVLGLPYMAAASWKGLLRSACRMEHEHGLLQHLDAHHGSLKGWREPDDIIHLFGPHSKDSHDEGREQDGWKGQRGALAFRPTWFCRGTGDDNKLIGFEVINPHSREKKAGKAPITYEVVMPGARGSLALLYAPAPGQIERDKVRPSEVLDLLLRAIQALLETYGMSAKRTAGWGLAKIDAVRLTRRGHEDLAAPTIADARKRLIGWLVKEGSR